MSDSRAENLMSVAGQAFQNFMPFRQLGQSIADSCYPMRADFTRSLEYENYAGMLMDGTPVHARENLGNAIDAMLRQGSWFNVGTGDQERDEKPGNAVALNRATSKLRSILKDRRSNWMNATKTADMDWVAFGNPVLSVEESSTRDFILFRAWHPRDCAWILDEAGRIAMFFRKMRMQAIDIMALHKNGAYGGEVSPAVREAATKDPSRRFDLMHCLLRADAIYGGDLQKMKELQHPFLSCYLDCENRTYLREMGTPVFNYVAPRMRTLGDLPFGFSPMALNSLQDSRMLQDMALVLLEQGQKAVDPPMVGAGNVFQRDINLFAGGFTEVDLGEYDDIRKVMSTVDTGERINVGLEMKADVRALIAESWLTNKLMLPTLRDMREVEVMVRTEEFRRAALPFFQPIETNYHGELLGTTFEVAVNMGILRGKDFPKELAGRDTVFTFESPLNEAEGKKLVGEYYEMINILATGAQVDKSINNLADIRKATEEAISKGIRPEWLIPEEDRPAADEQAAVESGLTQAASIAREASGASADLANASMAAQQAGLMPAA